jgi:hypothetical protein
MVPGPHHALSPCRDAAFRVGARYSGERPARAPDCVHIQCGLTESASESLTHRHAREPPPHLRPSRATPTAASRAPRRAPCCCLSRGPEGGVASAAARSLLVYAARARASLQRAPRASARRRVSGSTTAFVAVLCVCAMACAHARVSVRVASLVCKCV